MNNTSSAAVLNEGAEEVRYVTFHIGNETFGINVMNVREVMYLVSITEVPDTLPFMRGVIDLRGVVVPLIDARKKFNLPQKDYGNETVIIILEFSKQIMGLIVDQVLDVANIPGREIQKGEYFTGSESIEKDYIKGIARIDDKLIIVLDVDKIITKEEYSKIRLENK